MVILGFDPGGEKQYGWCVAQATNSRLRLHTSGIASNAAEAVTTALSKTGGVGRIEAAGLDSPLL